MIQYYIALVQFSVVFCMLGWKLNKFMPSHVFVVDRSRKKWKAINIELKGRLLHRTLCLRLKMSAKFATRRSLPTEREENASIVNSKSAPAAECKSQFLGRNRWIRNYLSVFYREKCVKDTIVMLGVIYNFSLFWNNFFWPTKGSFYQLRKYMFRSCRFRLYWN